MSEVATSRFVQIAVAMAPQQANLIYALDDAGGVWFYRDTKKKWVRVPDERFAPVKTTADLLRVRSDAYRRDSEEQVVPTPGGLGGAIAVELDAKHFRTVGELEQRTPHGPPSLVGCPRLVARGDVRFGGGVVIEGDVTLEAPSRGRLDVPDGARLRG